MNNRLPKKSIGKLERIKPNTSLSNSSVNRKWSPIFNSLNIVGTVKEAYVKTLAYKLEVQRLKAEEKSIIEQAKIANNVIDSKLKIEITKLENRRIELIAFYQTFNNNLTNNHILKQDILEIAKSAQKAMMDPKLPIEEKKLQQELATFSIRQLGELNTTDALQIENLANKLPEISTITNLLNE